MDEANCILLVDDSPSNLMVLEGIFSTMPFRTASVKNGPQALDWLEHNQADLILLDVMMPRMDGFEVCRRIKSRSEWSDLPILFLTAKDTIEDVAMGFQCGAVDYIPKPFQPLELISRVEAHLQLRHSRKEILQMNSRLNQVNSKLTELNLTKDRLLSIIAHDLRGPLSAFSNISELLHREFDCMSQEDVQHSLAVMQRDSKRILSLLENLLEWSRLQIGASEVRKDPVSLNQLIQQVLPLFAEIRQAKQVEILCDLEKELVAEVDTYMLQTVIRNLISNAIKFSRPRGKVFIHASRGPSSVEVSIRDEGVGIPEERLDSLFNLYRVESTRGTSGEKGSGLGLILCKELMEKNSGNIRCESIPGQGTTFHLLLPKSKT